MIIALSIALSIAIGVALGAGVWVELLMADMRGLRVQLADARKYGDYWWAEYRAMRQLALAAAARLDSEPPRAAPLSTALVAGEVKP